MLGAIEELRAKPIWSAAQRAQLAALSDRLRTATVAGETEQLRELLPRASQAVNALILAAQTVAQRRAAAARYVPAPNVGTGGMDLGQPDYSYQYLSETTNSEEILRHDVQAIVRALKKAEANPFLSAAKRRRAAHLHRRIRSARRRDKLAQLQDLMARATREIASHKRLSSKRVSRARTDVWPPSVAHIHTPPRHILRPGARLTWKLSAQRLGASGDSGTPRLQLATPFADTPGPFPLISIGKDAPITDPLCPPTWEWVAPFSPDWPCAQGDDLCRKTVWCRQGGRVVNGHTAWSEHFSSYAGMELLDEAYFQLTGERVEWSTYKDMAKHFLATMLIPIAEAVEHTTYYGRIALGWEPLPSNTSRLEVAAETVFGLYDIFSWGAFSNIRYGFEEGDLIQTGIGFVGILGFVSGVSGLHSMLRGTFFGVEPGGIISVAYETGTVYDRITPLSTYWPGHKIPQSFYLNTGDETFFVLRSGTRHMPEYLTRPMRIPGLPGHAARGAMSVSPLQDQVLLTSFDSAVRYAVQSGVYKNFGEVIIVGDWELIFREGTGGPYNVIIHARYRPGGKF